ncbi:hypothetical protein BK133_11050 [Paenibacillus sp. FSL H8-0548]|uniref:hypothetical protein n=1 Tax=Paenibacillus sp. FSL H8-0548 TaxID=1920422 RepID=UPI0009701BAC|nr:hypothetical protein [Paenibacillus sp. FSL H8-0548]OMF35241.1 hypothetical protein BK133_11050 [Paenibacillus sp. FSL H8-0548]
MQRETVIQSITVGQNQQQTYTVGDEVDERVVNRIEKYVCRHGSEYHILDEDGEAIVHVEYMPVVVTYKTIVVDDDETPNYTVSDELPF